MNHDFLLLAEDANSYSDYMKYADPRSFLQSNLPHVRIHDSLLQYISDSLQWIPSINPAKDAQAQRGLNCCGVTAINKRGAAKAKRLFQTWADLFAQGPKRIHLTGEFFWTEGKPPQEGSYERLSFDRDAIVSAMRQLTDFAEKCVSGEFYILHLGY